MPVIARMVVAAAFAAAACGGGDADPGPAEVELGTGATGFEAITDGQDLYVIQGPQGGFHMLGSVSASGVVAGDPDNLDDPDNPHTVFRAFRGSQRIDLGAADYHQGLRPVAETGGVGMVGRLVILDITDDAELDGAEVRLEVEITDARGATATDERTVTAVPHPDNL